MPTLTECLRFVLQEYSNAPGVQTLHGYQDKNLQSGFVFNPPLHWIVTDPANDAQYQAWLTEGNPPPTVTVVPPPTADPKYAALPGGTSPEDHRRTLYQTWVDPHLLASLSYNAEGDFDQAAVERTIALEEKAAIRFAFPDA